MIEQLAEILAEAASTEVLPRRPPPGAAEFVEPWRAEVVTEADLASEAQITPRLRELKKLPVVGEEAAKNQPELLALTAKGGSYWLLDPIDGTAAFAAGRDDFGVMAALVIDGQTVAAAVHMPVSARSFVAEQGSGAFEDGRALSSTRKETGSLRGTMYSSFFDEDLQASLDAAHATLGEGAPFRYAAAFEYTDVARGDKDYVVYGRLRPWDHAPGSLIVREAGGFVTLHGGEEYAPDVEFGPSIAAGGERVLTRVRAVVADALHRNPPGA